MSLTSWSHSAFGSGQNFSSPWKAFEASFAPPPFRERGRCSSLSRLRRGGIGHLLGDSDEARVLRIAAEARTNLSLLLVQGDSTFAGRLHLMVPPAKGSKIPKRMIVSGNSMVNVSSSIRAAATIGE